MGGVGVIAYRCTEPELADSVDKEGDALHESRKIRHGFFRGEVEDESKESLVFALRVLIRKVEGHKVVDSSLCFLTKQLQSRNKFTACQRC